MNYIIKSGKNFIAMTNNIEADAHKHWMLQMFLSSSEPLNIEVDEQHISSQAIIVNMDRTHAVHSAGAYHFTLLIDPTTKLGRAARSLLKGESYYVFSPEKTSVMQQDFQQLLKEQSHYNMISFAERIINEITTNHVTSFDERINTVLYLLDNCMCEDESHQITYLSEKTYLSESRLAHLFKKQTGIPLNSYLVLHKLQKAYESILNGKDLTMAAMEADFYSPSHFSYTNKLMTGMSATNIIKDSEFLKVDE